LSHCFRSEQGLAAHFGKLEREGAAAILHTDRITVLREAGPLGLCTDTEEVAHIFIPSVSHPTICNVCAGHAGACRGDDDDR
jgi:hypothetical protein